MAALQEQIQEALVRSELLAEQGDIDGSQAAATQAENLKVGPLPTSGLGVMLFHRIATVQDTLPTSGHSRVAVAPYAHCSSRRHHNTITILGKHRGLCGFALLIDCWLRFPLWWMLPPAFLALQVQYCRSFFVVHSHVIVWDPCL